MAGSRNLEEDRIGSLPDEILAHILSSLPTTTQAAATSILSRRWRHLYCLTDSLIFKKSFTRLTLYTLNNIMMQRGVNPLRKVSLELDRYFTEWDEDMSLEPRMFHTLQELELASEYRLPNVPLQLWNNKHLVTLKLSCTILCMPMRRPELVCLPRLRSLHLDGFLGMESEFINMIFKNSPSLENFTLSGCSLKERGVHRFCGKALKSLILDGYHRHGDQRPKVVIDAPSLTHFQCNTNYDCKFKKLNALKEDSIMVIWKKYNAVLNMLYAVAKVKVLHLPGEVLEVLEKSKLMGHFFELPLFSNLSLFALDLSWACNPGSMFWEMLSRSPRLQTVTFPRGILYMERSPNQALSISLTNLKTFEVHFFNRCEEDSFLIEHLVQNIESLEKVILHKRRPMDVEEELQLQMSIRRSSRHCSIEFK